jgi:hypothetical protein
MFLIFDRVDENLDFIESIAKLVVQFFKDFGIMEPESGRPCR